MFTTPNYYYRAIKAGDNGLFSKEKDGGHVSRGYTMAMLMELCEHAGLICENTSFCSGFLRQKTTFLLRMLSRVHLLLGWIMTLPLRILPPILDSAITNLIHWPYFSICIEAYKPMYMGCSDGDKPSKGLGDSS